VAAQTDDPDSFLSLYRAALRLRREVPVLRAGGLRWLDAPADVLAFARDPGFAFAANLSGAPVPLASLGMSAWHPRVLLSSGPLVSDRAGGAALPRDTAVWLAV
jgi:alpha-glucosidase